MKMDQQELSKSVYMDLCVRIGIPEQITNRREVSDISEIFKNKGGSTEEFYIMSSGSTREGFRLKGKDMDIMIWRRDHRVLWDFSQMYNTQRHNVILCDGSQSPPGFTLLFLPLKKAHRIVVSSCIRMNGALYISSGMYKRNMAVYLTSPFDFKIHGPCITSSIGPVEYDDAHCFFSDIWPPPASSWKDRCKSWPPPSIVEDIVGSGCHFVAIGHKHGIHEDNEWRISFSQAEQKLVFAMNHTQFLTYGMLKLFIKEFNNALSDEEKILCSYHMKTAIFWAIQQNTITDWCPQNLLAGFWDCFKLVLKWIYEGVCPNFFIPENNMFLNKVHGVVQTNLFTRLYGLYEKGLEFLLQSLFLDTYMNIISNPKFSVCTDERACVSEAELDVDLFYEIHTTDGLCKIPNLNSCIQHMHILEQLIRQPWTQCQITMLQKFACTIFQTSAYMLHAMHTKPQRVNKQMYIVDKIACFMLKLTAKFGFISDMFYIAMFYYKTFRHREALSVIEMIKVKLAQPGLLYVRHVDSERYTEAVGGQSWSYKMRQAVALATNLDNRIFYIKELMPEQLSGLLDEREELYIPPIITLHMLEFLCCRHVDPLRGQATLDKLRALVHHDPGVRIPVYLRDISWQILGICQQITGNHQAALYSYHQSLWQCPWNKLQIVTILRIHLFANLLNLIHLTSF